MINTIISFSYLVAAALFILGLKRMSSPKNARQGIVWAGVGMVLATIVTFAYPDLHNFALMGVAIVTSSILAWWSAKKVAMTDMPQMIALYNGMGGGAAAAIAAVELVKLATAHDHVSSLPFMPVTYEHSVSLAVMILAILGGLIGTVAFSGSLIAFAKLQGWMNGVIRFKGQRPLNGLAFLGTLCLGFIMATQVEMIPGTTEIFAGTFPIEILLAFFILSLVFGVMMTVPIGGADMPVVISLFNALTGLAVGFEGFVLGNAAMMIAGTVVGSAGFLLTQLMAKAMNRSLSNVLFSNFGSVSSGEATEISGSMKPIEAADVGVMMAYAEKVLIIPGYGMAVAQAQHKIWELTQLLSKNGVKVKFAIHPVAGRMPGHMNVLLAEAGVPYDIIEDLDEVNEEFATADVCLVIGANDVVNPDALENPESPIYGMPILNAWQAKNCIVIKRGQGRGFSGIENALFFADNTRMLYGDGQAATGEIINAVKEMT